MLPDANIILQRQCYELRVISEPLLGRVPRISPVCQSTSRVTVYQGSPIEATVLRGHQYGHCVS